MKIVVAGAGVIGCAIAYELAVRGADVVLLDMRQPGAGATRASAGVLAPYIEGHVPGLLRLGTASLSRYDGFVARVTADSGHRLEYRRTGTLEVAANDAQAEVLLSRANGYAAAGVEHRALGREDVRALEPALAASVQAALLVPSQGYVAAGAFTAALAGAAQQKGATITSGMRVERVAPSGEGVRVFSATETVAADAVILAAGSWSGQVSIERAASAPVRPIRGQLLQIACATPPVSRVLWGTDCYLVPWQDGTLLVGATVEDVGFDEGATVAGVRDLLEAACELVPSAWTARFEAVRVGLRPVTCDELPIIGRASALPRVVYATGHYRNGVLLAPFTAAAVADLVLEGREAPELALTSPARFGL